MILRPIIRLHGNIAKAKYILGTYAKPALDTLKRSMTFQGIKQLSWAPKVFQDGSSYSIKSIFGIDMIEVYAAPPETLEQVSIKGPTIIFLSAYDITTHTQQWGVWKFDDSSRKFTRIDMEIPEFSSDFRKHPSTVKSNHNFSLHSISYQGNFHQDGNPAKPLLYWSDSFNYYGMYVNYLGPYYADSSFGTIDDFMYRKPYYTINEEFLSDWLNIDPVTGSSVSISSGGARNNSQIVKVGDQTHYHQIFRVKPVTISGVSRLQISYYDMDASNPVGIIGTRVTGADFPTDCTIKAILSKDKILGTHTTLFTGANPDPAPGVYIGMGANDLFYTEGPTTKSFRSGDSVIEDGLTRSLDASITGIHHDIYAMVSFRSGWTWADQTAVFADVEAHYPNSIWDFGALGGPGNYIYQGRDEWYASLYSVHCNFDLNSNEKNKTVTLMDYDNADADETFIVLYALDDTDLTIAANEFYSYSIGYVNGAWVNTWQRTGPAIKTFKMAYRINGGSVIHRTLGTLTGQVNESLSALSWELGGAGEGTSFGIQRPGPGWQGGHIVYNSILSGDKPVRVSCKVTPNHLLYTYSIITFIGTSPDNIVDFLAETAPDEFMSPTDWKFERRILGVINRETGAVTEVEVDSDFLQGTTLDDPARAMAIGLHKITA